MALQTAHPAGIDTALAHKLQAQQRRRWVRRGVLALVLLGLVLGGWLWMKNRPAKERPAPYRTAALDQGPITQVVMATGTLQPVIQVTVGTQVSGTVLERLADFNSRVNKGQVLLRLDPAALEARLRQVRAQLASAEAGLALARANYERNERLVAQGFISALALDQSKRELDVARASTDQARGSVEQAQTDINNSVIRSPIDGVVIRRNTDVGQTVAASFQTPELFVIAKDLRQMIISANVSEADVGLIREGQPVRFLVDAYPEREFEGKVQQFRLNSTNTQGVITYAIVVAVSNPEELLKPGMTAQVRIVVAQKDRVTRVPTAALRFRPDEDELSKSAKAAASDAPSKPSNGGAASPGPAASRPPAEDDGVLSGMRSGARVYRLYTVGPDRKPVLHEVTIGIANTRYTELKTGDLKPGDAVITRKADPATGQGQ